MPGMRVQLVSVLLWSASFVLAPAAAQTPPEAVVPKPAVVADQVPGLLADLRGDDRQRGFTALCRLAVLGHHADVLPALLTIAGDAAADEGWREYAAMGLGNMHGMPATSREQVRAAMRAALAAERVDCPDGIVSLLVALGEAPFVRDTLGDGLQGHRHEIAVLERLPDERSRARLLAIVAASPGRKAEAYQRRFLVGRALLRHGDRRGVEVLVQLLPRADAPGQQQRRNVHAVAAPVLAAGFSTFPAECDAELDAAIDALLAFWQQHGAAFELAGPSGGPLSGPAPELAAVVAAWGRDPGSSGDAEALDGRSESWLDEPVLRRLFPGWSFCRIGWWREAGAGDRPRVAGQTTLAIRDGNVVQELQRGGNGADFGALLATAGAVATTDTAVRVLWEAFMVLHGQRWPLRHIERPAGGGVVLEVVDLHGTARRYGLDVDARGQVCSGRWHVDAMR
jgi:hypothetical protein